MKSITQFSATFLILLVIFALASVLQADSAINYKSLAITKLNKSPINFSLKDLKGRTITLSKFKNKKVVFLNFWATWCPPCRAEMPDMQKLYKAMKKKDFIILSIDVGESKKAVSSFVKENKYTFPILLDTKGIVSAKYNKAFKMRGIPTTFIINKKGKIIGQAVGAREWSGKKYIELFKKLAK